MEKQGKHSIHLQVWRTTGRHYEFPVYSLVGANKFDIEPPKSRVLYYISPPTLDQITVQPGDIIGFYLQNNASIEDDFTIQYNPHAKNVTLQFVMSDEPLAVIEETTLSVQMLKTAPVITVDIAGMNYGALMNTLCIDHTCGVEVYAIPSPRGGSHYSVQLIQHTIIRIIFVRKYFTLVFVSFVCVPYIRYT